MMNSVDDYLAQLPDDRRAAIVKVRDVINANLPTGYEEKLQYGMISWCVPESVLPAKEVYNKQPLAFASLGSQKSYMAVYLTSLYGDLSLRSWFEKAYKQTGKKLDMGKGCVRFKTLEALPLEVIGEAVSKTPVESYVTRYRQVHEARKNGANAAATTTGAKAATKPDAKPAATKPNAKAAPTKTAAKKPGKPAAKKTAAKNAAAKKPAKKPTKRAR